MSKNALRPYQRRAVDAAFKEWEQGRRSTLYVAPTGSGKTRTFCAVAARYKRTYGGRVLVLADRRWLVDQSYDAAIRHAMLRAGVEMATQRVDRRRLPDLVVASVQSIARRLHDFAPTAFSLVIADEADLALAPTYRRVIGHFPAARLLGVTATADRTDGIALGELFESVADEVELPELIRGGYLVPVRQRAVRVLDLKRIPVKGPDLDEKLLDKILQEERHLHEVVRPTMAAAGDRPTVVYATSVDHAKALAALFNRYRKGCAAVIHGKLNPKQRKRVTAGFLARRTQFLVNCSLLLRGVDIPRIACIAVARPTQSRTLYAQALGRGLRTSPETGKRDLLVLDFTDNADELPLITAVDVLGGKALPEVKERARELLDEEPEQDVLEVLEQAKADVERDPAIRERVRAKVRFKTRPPRDRIDWATAGLGEESDARRAKEFGVDAATVRTARLRLGIPPYRIAKKQAIHGRLIELGLGRLTDAEVARVAGMKRSYVSQIRRAIGLAAVSAFGGSSAAVHARGKKRIVRTVDLSRFERLIGHLSDREVARLAGCCHGTVRRWRLGMQTREP